MAKLRRPKDGDEATRTPPAGQDGEGAAGTSPAERAAAAKKPRKTQTPADLSSARYPWVCTLRKRRDGLRLSLRDVAQGVKLSIARLHEIERGGDPRLSTATRIAAFFAVSLTEMWPERRDQQAKE